MTRLQRLASATKPNADYVLHLLPVPLSPWNVLFIRERCAPMSKDPLLSAALVIFGVPFCSVFPLSIFWASGWAWNSGGPMASDYFLMIVVVYFTLGIFMIRAARDPSANRSLIWFVVWSSLGHALVMTWEAFRTPMMTGHLVGDVPALFIAAAFLAALMARSSSRAVAA